MSVGQAVALPKEVEADSRRVARLAWISIFGLASAALLLGLTRGQSQTIKTAWIGDMLAIIPPIGSLVAMRFEFRPAAPRFPFGYLRAISVALRVAAAVLSLIGLWLLYDAVLTLVHREHPSIGTMELFGRELWAGWAMVAALAYSSIAGFGLWWGDAVAAGLISLTILHRGWLNVRQVVAGFRPLARFAGTRPAG